MSDNKHYFTSRDIKKILQKELNNTMSQKMKNDILGISIWLGAVFFLWSIIYYLLIWFNSGLNLFEFSVVFFTILLSYIFVGYLFNDMASGKDQLLKDINLFGAREQLAGIGALMGCIFFPTVVLVSLGNDLILGFKYSDSDIELAGKMISYLKNSPDDVQGHSFKHIKKIFIENSEFTIAEIRKVINFMYKNGLIRVEVNKNDNDESMLTFVKSRYDELFNEYLIQREDDEQD